MVLQNNGDEIDAKDIFQEAIAAIFRKALTQKFVLTCPFDYFIYMICRNKWLSVLKKRKSEGVTFIDAEEYNNIGEDSFKMAEDLRLQEERKKLIIEKLAELSESCQELLRLSWGGKLMEEVGRLLNLTHGGARKKKSGCKGSHI